MSIMSIETVSNPNPEWDFGDRIRKVRRSIAQMDQQQMADTLGVTRQVYAAWEAGRTKPTDIVAMAKRIADQWPGRVTSAWLLGVEDAAPPRPPQPTMRPFGHRRQGPVRRLRPVEENGDIAVDDDALAYLRLATDDDQPTIRWADRYRLTSEGFGGYLTNVNLPHAA